MLRATLLLSLVSVLAACSDDTTQQPVMYQPMYYSMAPNYMAPPMAMTPLSDTVYFSLGRANLSQETQQTLRAQLDWLRTHPQPSLLIEGYADDRGSESYNLELGARRARAVRDFFVRNGVPAALIAIVSYGKDRPAVPGTDELSRSRNRRTVTAGG